jgi:hypothetical protein
VYGRTYANAHIHTHTHTRARAHTHTHTHTQVVLGFDRVFWSAATPTGSYMGYASTVKVRGGGGGTTSPLQA